MGIQDRDYYRQETAGSLWLTGETPAVRGLVVANIIVFVIQLLNLTGSQCAIQSFVENQ